MCTRYPIINRVSELKVHIELTRFVQPEKIEIDANERAVNEKSQYCFFVCTTFDSFLNDLQTSRIYILPHNFSKGTDFSALNFHLCYYAFFPLSLFTIIPEVFQFFIYHSDFFVFGHVKTSLHYIHGTSRQILTNISCYISSPLIIIQGDFPSKAKKQQ